MSREAESYSVDMDKLLAPIAPDRPEGEDLRYEGTYDRVRDARREDDAQLSQGIYTSALKKADWRQVQEICTQALSNKTKDLQLAAWLLEAWLHLYGFAGVDAGLTLFINLCRGFWETIHPKSTEGIEARIAPVEWMNEKLCLKLKTVPVTWPQLNDVPTYTFADWETAWRLENLAGRNSGGSQTAEGKGKVTLAEFNSSVMHSPREYYSALSNELGNSFNTTVELERFLDEECGNQAPSLSRFKETLANVQLFVRDILTAREAEDPAVTDDEEFARAVEEEGLWTGSPIRSRAEAYQRLSQAADYLLMTEPHSPAPYLVKRAVEWGRMSLYEVFGQIIRSDSELDELNKLLRLGAKEKG